MVNDQPPVSDEWNVPPVPKIAPSSSLYDTAREPEDTSDLVKHPHQKTFPLDGGAYCLRDGWHLIGASRRGYAHTYEGKYREDDFSISTIGDEAVLIAIADGLSSRTYSRRGALAAVEGATSLPGQQLHDLIALVNANPHDSCCQSEAFRILMDALEAARDSISQQAEQDQIDSGEFKTTLLVFLAIPCQHYALFTASVQVGDGALFALEPGENAAPRDQWRWLQQPQIQEIASEVQPFQGTDAATWSKFFQCDLLLDARFLMGMTDGTANDIEPPRGTSENPDPDPFFLVHDFYQYLEAHVLHSDRPANALFEFLGYRKRSSFDDRTVVCLYQKKVEED